MGGANREFCSHGDRVEWGTHNHTGEGGSKVTQVDISELQAKSITFAEPVRTLILTEPRILEASEFIVKICDWLKIIEMGRGAVK